MTHNGTQMTVWHDSITPEFKKRFNLAAAAAGRKRGEFAAAALAEAVERVLGKPLAVAPIPVAAPAPAKAVKPPCKWNDAEYRRAYMKQYKAKKRAEWRAAEAAKAQAEKPAAETKRERHLRLMREAQRRKQAELRAKKIAVWAEYGWQGEGVGA